MATPGAENLERFLQTFERSARRWEPVAYPVLLAFIVLAGYGFFPVYSLTADMQRISRRQVHYMAEKMESPNNIAPT